MSEKRRFAIMFVCTGNTCRSPMAEYAMRMLAEKERPGQAEVFSSGTAAADGFPATQYAQEAGKIWDLDLSAHRSQMLSRQLIDRANLILCMTSQHHREVTRLDGDAAHKTFLLKNFPDNHPVGESVEDPIGQSLDKYNEAFLEIAEYLGSHLPEIIRLIDARPDA